MKPEIPEICLDAAGSVEAALPELIEEPAPNAPAPAGKVQMDEPPSGWIFEVGVSMQNGLTELTCMQLPGFFAVPF